MENVIDIAKLKIEELVNLNNNKRNYLKKLYEITKLQTIDISSNSLNSLLDHIKQKQDIMNAIDDIDKKFYTEFQDLKLHLGIKSLEDVDINEYPEIASLKFSVKETIILISSLMYFAPSIYPSINWFLIGLILIPPIIPINGCSFASSIFDVVTIAAHAPARNVASSIL